MMRVEMTGAAASLSAYARKTRRARGRVSCSIVTRRAQAAGRGGTRREHLRHALAPQVPE
jgi:hypothetical protein